MSQGTTAPQVTGFQCIRFAVASVNQALEAYGRLLGIDPTSANGFQLDNVSLAFSSLGTLQAENQDAEAEGLLGFSLASESSGTFIVEAPYALEATVLEDLVVEPKGWPELSADGDRDIAAIQQGRLSSHVHGLDHLVIRSKDVDATVKFYGEALGLRVLFDREFPDWNVRLCMCRVGEAVLEIAGALSEAAEAQDLDVSKAVEGAPVLRDQLWGLTWRVGDAEAARSRLSDSGTDVSKVRPGRRPGTQVFTVRSGTCGVPTLMIQV